MIRDLATAIFVFASMSVLSERAQAADADILKKANSYFELCLRNIDNNKAIRVGLKRAGLKVGRSSNQFQSYDSPRSEGTVVITPRGRSKFKGCIIGVKSMTEKEMNDMATAWAKRLKAKLQSSKKNRTADAEWLGAFGQKRVRIAVEYNPKFNGNAGTSIGIILDG